MDGSDAISSEVSLFVTEEKFKITTSFKNLYKAQTGWNILDHRLGDELYEIVSRKVLPTYSNFLATYTSLLEGSQHATEYSTKELGGLLLDLFQGVPLQVQK